MSQTPRHINTDRSLSRPGQAARAPQAAPEQNTRSTAGAQHAPPPRRPAQPDMGGNDAPRRRKKKKKTPLWLPFAIVMGVIAVISGVVVYGVSLVNKVEDSIRPAESAPSIVEEIQTAEEYKGDVVNILVCGIDFEEDALTATPAQRRHDGYDRTASLISRAVHCGCCRSPATRW